jgi:hypothetical protein
MKLITWYIKEYFYATEKRILAVVTVFTGILIFLNYQFGIDGAISRYGPFTVSFISRYFIFLTAFAVPYGLYALLKKEKYIRQPLFIFLLLLAPAIFSLKTSLNVHFNFSTGDIENKYWNRILYWPVHLVVIISILLIVWKIFEKNQPFYGIKLKGISWKPYFLMLLIMLPLIAAASTQADFLAMYPKVKVLAGNNSEMAITWWQKLLFEISYGTDFISVELFFRGFLILAFIKWAGKDAILPMACFYCTIHFGKPLAECISSYFGGIILGVVVYHTRSIFGGLMVHLGIAWLMELGGLLGNNLFRI